MPDTKPDASIPDTSISPAELTSLDLSPSNLAQAARIEEASLNAWPALRQVLLDGWILRFSKGFTKRSNSIIPLYAGATQLATQSTSSDAEANSEGVREALAEKIRYCENMYSREQLQTIFRLNSIQAEHRLLDQLLRERGYQYLDMTQVMHCSLSDLSQTSHNPITHTTKKVQIHQLPLDQWLAIYSGLTGMQAPGADLHRVILASIAGEAGYFALSVDDQPCACGLGVVERDLVGLFDIYTGPEARRQGYGQAIVSQILQWGAQQHASQGYLQVVGTNRPAIELYRRLGFTPIYAYWYRSSQ